MKFYAVRVGRQPGVYTTWDECKGQVHGFKGAVYKAFDSEQEALQFTLGTGAANAPTTPTAVHAQTTKTKKVGAEPEPTGLAGLTIYCDGACSNNGKPGAKAGVGVYFGKGDPRNVCERLSPTTFLQTNNVAELMAAIRALEMCRAKGETEAVNILTDSAYVVNGMNIWRRGWKASGKWNDATTLKNLDLWHRLDALADGHVPGVTFHWVKGHATSVGNTAADKLARLALNKET
jgi:ribonuclease HI